MRLATILFGHNNHDIVGPARVRGDCDQSQAGFLRGAPSAHYATAPCVFDILAQAVGGQTFFALTWRMKKMEKRLIALAASLALAVSTALAEGQGANKKQHGPMLEAG